MSRPPKDPALVAKALALVDAGSSPEEAAARIGGIGKSTIYEAMKRRGSVVSAPARPPKDDPPAGERDKEIDALIARSRTWLRVQQTLAEALAPHPAAARDVAKALRRMAL